MKHTISKKDVNLDILELNITHPISSKTIFIDVMRKDSEGAFLDYQAIELNPDELSAFIGCLLHVKSKIKR